ncbi:MAG: hypothetical protein AAGI07_13535, partial [Bacteroidota bacterium]
MQIKYLSLLFFFLLAVSFNIYAQDATDKNKPPVNLNAAFEELKSKSTDYEDYEVIKKLRLNNFWKQVTDTLSVKESAYKTSQAEIKELKTKIMEMEIEMQKKDKQVADSQYLVDHLEVLGIPFNKNSY